MENRINQVILLLYGSDESLENMYNTLPSLFPDKNYIILGVIPRIKGRITYTSLYREVVSKWIEYEGRLALERIGSRISGKIETVIKKGKLSNVLRSFIRSHRGSVVVLNSLVPPNEKFFTSIASCILQGYSIVLIFTPKTKTSLPPLKYLLILKKSVDIHHIDLMYYFSRGSPRDIDVLWIDKPDINALNRVLELSREKYHKQRLSINRIDLNKLTEHARHGLKEYDIILVSGYVFYKRGLLRYKLSELAKALIISSERPIVLVPE